MNATPARAPWLLALSLAFYRSLLLLYPARFRRAYATQMAQVFHTSCQQACRVGGAVALAHVWRVTLGDLIMTALAERIEEVTVMERRSLTRAAGLAGLIGGALLLFYGLIQLLDLFATRVQRNAVFDTLFDGRSPISLPLSWAQTIVVPIAWACIIVVICGLCVRLARDGGWEVWLAGSVALIGSVMCLLGTFSLIIGSWNSWNYWHDSIAAYINQISGDPLPYLASLDLFGRMVVGLGLLALALSALRSASSWRVKTLTLILGATALLPFAYIYLTGPSLALANGGGLAHYGGRVPYTPFSLPFPAGFDAFFVLIAIVATAFALVWGVGLLLLGVRFLRDGQLAVAQPTQPAPAMGMRA